MAFGVSSPQHILYCRCGVNQARGAEVSEHSRAPVHFSRRLGAIDLQRYIVGYSRSIQHGNRRNYCIRAAEQSKAGFGRQPMKKKKVKLPAQPCFEVSHSKWLELIDLAVAGIQETAT